MNEFADMVSKEVRCSLANDFWSRISCGDYVELYLIFQYAFKTTSYEDKKK